MAPMTAFETEADHADMPAVCTILTGRICADLLGLALGALPLGIGLSALGAQALVHSAAV